MRLARRGVALELGQRGALQGGDGDVVHRADLAGHRLGAIERGADLGCVAHTAGGAQGAGVRQAQRDEIAPRAVALDDLEPFLHDRERPRRVSG